MKPLRYVIEADKNDVHRSRDGQEDEDVQQTHTEKVVENYIAFSTPTRIVGIIKLPLDGDPTKVTFSLSLSKSTILTLNLKLSLSLSIILTLLKFLI